MLFFRRKLNFLTSLTYFVAIVFTISLFVSTRHANVSKSLRQNIQRNTSNSDDRCPLLGVDYSRRKVASNAKTPPWVELLKNADSAAALYVSEHECETRRLGNQMFNYAGLFGIAWRNGRVPIWPQNTQVGDVFKIRAHIDINNTILKNPASKFQLLREPAPMVYGNFTERLPKRNVTLAIFLQSWKYFSLVEDQLRLDFTFQDHILNQAKDFINSSTPEAWRSAPFSRVVVHARRTDYAAETYVNDGWPRLTADYFSRAMEFFRSCLPRVQFIVISDDIAWCMTNIRGPNVVYSHGHSPAVDLAIASLCDHAIISIGSFGNWVAWMANGVTVTFRDVPRPNSTLSRILHREDFYKPDFIGI